MGTRVERTDAGLTVLRLIVTVSALAVVVVVLGLGISTRRSVGDESAKRHARAASEAASQFVAETGNAPTVEELAEYAPGLEYESLDPGEEVAVQGKVYVRSRAGVADLAARSGDTCFWVQRAAASAPRYAQGSCDGDPAQLVFRDHW